MNLSDILKCFMGRYMEHITFYILLTIGVIVCFISFYNFKSSNNSNVQQQDEKNGEINIEKNKVDIFQSYKQKRTNLKSTLEVLFSIFLIIVFAIYLPTTCFVYFKSFTFYRFISKLILVIDALLINIYFILISKIIIFRFCMKKCYFKLVTLGDLLLLYNPNCLENNFKFYKILNYIFSFALNIFFLLISPDYLITKKIKSKVDNNLGNVIKIFNYSNLTVTLLIFGIIYYLLFRFKNENMLALFRYVVYYRCISRGFELFLSFGIDCIEYKKSTSLSPNDRIYLLMISLLELIVMFVVVGIYPINSISNFNTFGDDQNKITFDKVVAVIKLDYKSLSFSLDLVFFLVIIIYVLLFNILAEYLKLRKSDDV